MKAGITVRAAIAAPLLLLAACNDEPAATKGEGDADAAAEVLEGTISDEMLPLDRVRSQPPLAEGEGEDEGGSGDEDGEDAGEASSDETAE